MYNIKQYIQPTHRPIKVLKLEQRKLIVVSYQVFFSINIR